MYRKRRVVLSDEAIRQELLQLSELDPEEDLDIRENASGDEGEEEDQYEMPGQGDDSDADPYYGPESDECSTSDEEEEHFPDSVLPPEGIDVVIQHHLEQVNTENGETSAASDAFAHGTSSASTQSGGGKCKRGPKLNPKGRNASKGSNRNKGNPKEIPTPRLVSFDSDEVEGKNGFVWKTAPIHTSERIRAKNIVYTKPGTVGAAYTAKTPLDCFNVLFTQDLKDIVKLHTNTELSKQRLEFKTPQSATLKDMSSEELNGLLGLFIRAAGLRDNHLSAEVMFDNLLTGNKYCCLFSRSRFNFLVNCLRFDGTSTREERQKESRLALIEDVWDILINNCKESYRPGSYLTIDEQLVGFRGNVRFKVYMPSKPNKYGIKIFMMCDNASKYMVNAMIYAGKGSTPANIPQAEYITLKLVEPIKGSNRNITCDNWFSSIPLTQKLLNDYSLTMVGTIKRNKAHFPNDFVSPKFKRRQQGTSLFLFSENLTAVSYKPENKAKTVVLVSTLHDDNAINSKTQKPKIIETYDSTKGGVDTFDQLCQNMCVNRKTRRWPLCLFYNMINIAVHNSYVIYLNNFYKDKQAGKPLTRFDFVMALADEITVVWMHCRLTTPIPTHLRTAICQKLKVSDPLIVSNQEEVNGNTQRVYCSFCSYKLRRKSKQCCKGCGSKVCGEHHAKICPDCSRQFQDFRTAKRRKLDMVQSASIS